MWRRSSNLMNLIRDVNMNMIPMIAVVEVREHVPEVVVKAGGASPVVLSGHCERTSGEASPFVVSAVEDACADVTHFEVDS